MLYILGQFDGVYRCPMDATFGFPPRINIIETKSLNQNFETIWFSVFQESRCSQGSCFGHQPTISTPQPTDNKSNPYYDEQ